MIELEYLCKATGAKAADAVKYLGHINVALVKYDINTPQRVAGFLSQIGHESGGLSTVRENLNYKVEALLAMFGRHRISEEDARRFGRNDAIGQKANQIEIANRIYGGEFGRKNLGNTQPGDGSAFLGRGLKQLTGRDNYTRCGKALGLDLIANPELLEQPEGAALSAGWFWSSKNLNAIADKGDVAAMTKVINGGDIGLAQRQALYAAAIAAAPSLA